MRLAITVFKRYEKKYMLTMEQYDALREFLKDYMRYDKYCLHICRYLLFCGADLPDYTLSERKEE